MRTFLPARRTLFWLTAAVVTVASGVLGVAPAEAADGQPALVDDLSYPGAAQILAEQNVRLIAGDGHIRLVSCATPVSGDIGLVKVYTTDEAIGADGIGRVCFRVSGPTGLLTLQVPGVYEIRGDGLRSGAGHEISADLRTDGGEAVSVEVDPDGSTQVGLGADPHGSPTTLLRLVVADNGPSGALSSHPFVARVLAGDRGCAGVLIAPRWVATAKSCYGDEAVTAGAPPQETHVVVGRADLRNGGGHTSEVVEVVPRADRDLVLARLADPATGITPIGLADTAPAPAATVRAAGYGRGADGWPGDQLWLGTFTVTGTSAGTVELTRAAGTTTSTCSGDAGGPAFVEVDGEYRLTGVHSRSWQTGCVGVTESRDTAVTTRTDDIAGWIRTQTLDACQAPVEEGFTALRADGAWSVVGAGKVTDSRCELSLTGGAALAQYTARRMPAAYTLRLDFNPAAADADAGVVVGLPRVTDAAGARGVPVRTTIGGTGGASAGVWNALEVTVAQRRVTVRVNSTLVDDSTVTDPSLLLASGFLGLRADPAHPKVRFRNLRVRADQPGVDAGTVPVLYNYNNALTRMFVFQGVGGPQTAVPRLAWDSGAGNWEAARTRPISGDFDGNGTTDVAAFYNYGNGLTRLFLFRGVTGAGVTPVQVWSSAPGGWDSNRMKAVPGDFDGDGKTEIAAYYNYDNSLTRLWLFDNIDTETTARQVWDSGAGAWDWNRMKPVPGDFDGDGRTEIAAYYASDGSRTRLLLFRDVAGSTVPVTQVWDSGAGTWEGSRLTPLPGDFDGDGRTDIAAFYDYGNAHTRLFRFTDIATAASVAQAWEGGPNNWNAAKAKAVTGDFDGNGKSDLAAFYDYGNSQIKLWRFTAADATAQPEQVWDSGPGAWEWPRVLTAG